MTTRRLPAFLLAAGLALAPAAARAQSGAPYWPGTPDTPAEGGLAHLTDEFLDGWLARRPHLATRLGLHRQDALLLPVTQLSLREDAAWLGSLDDRLAAIPGSQLSFQGALERDVLATRLQLERIEILRLRRFERDPAAYLELVGDAIQYVLERAEGSPCNRLRAVTGRLRSVPEVLRAARVNLQHPPRLLVEMAIPRYEGLLYGYRVEGPALARQCGEALQMGDLAEADSSAVRAVEEFVAYLREDLLPRADGTLALGPDVLREWLADGLREPDPIDVLLQRARSEMERTHRSMEEQAARAVPGAGAAAVLDSLRSHALAADSLVYLADAGLPGLRRFVAMRQLVDRPGRDAVTVRPMPRYRLGAELARLDAPGPFESVPPPAFFEIGLPAPDWTPAQQRERLGRLDPWSLQVLTVEEVMPGRLFFEDARRRAPSRLRESFAWPTAARGWAHYCGSLATEWQLGERDPRTELVVQHDVLLQLARLVAVLSIHGQGMTVEQAAEFFQSQCYLGPEEARREAEGCAADLGRATSTLGRWRIQALRDEVKAALGTNFDLRRFHDAFLRQGGPPLPLARMAVLQELRLLR